MAQVLVEKQVLFSGIWRPRNTVDDAFLRTVSQQFMAKAVAQASWRLTEDGLTIVAQHTAAQTDQIPAQSIKEVTVNRHNPLCLMTLYVDDAQRFSVLVCRCQTELDAAHIVQVFRRLQKGLSGEGYRIDLKQPEGINWTLKTKQNGPKENAGSEDFTGDDQDHLDKNGNEGGTTSTTYTHHHHHHNHNNNKGEVVVEIAEENLEREPLEVEGRHCFNVGVQADLMADDDTVSITSQASYMSLKEELETLSIEVRDIKILLEQTTGISAEEFFRRRQDLHAPTLVPVKRLLSQDSEGGKSEKSVNFAEMPGDPREEEGMEFDIRSVGMQTEAGSKRGKYLKRVRNALTPNRYQQSHRTRSNGSSSSSPGPMSPLSSPFSMNRPQDGAVFFASPHGQGHVEARRDPRFVSHSLSRGSAVYPSGGGTVVRPIESVYHHYTHTSGFRQKRRQVIVLPNRSASTPRHIRAPPSVSSHTASSAGKHVHIQLPKKPADSAATGNGAS